MSRTSRIALVVAAFALAAAPVAADVELAPEGRRTLTNTKLVQAGAVGGTLYESPGRQAAGRALSTAGRGAHARPTQPVSVGLLGCPGCLEVLERAPALLLDHYRRSKWGR